MPMYRVLIMGASYGSLLAAKLLLAGHTVKLVCLPAEAQLINHEGIRVRLPVKGRDGLVEVDSRRAPGRLSAAVPDDVAPEGFDLVVLAMQEPQYRAPPVRKLLQQVVRSRIPCMSIMNMPPLPYLSRVPGLAGDAYRHCYTDPSVWDGFEPALMTLCSPDPQAFRPPDEKINVLQVSLPTNFKAARFDSDEHSAMLREMAAGIEGIRFADGGGAVDLPVKLKVHESVFVPLAKWSMLVAGNYRCITADGMRSIRDAVHGDLARSQSIYDHVDAVARKLGADPADQVPFGKYAKAAESLLKPSSAARAVAAGAPFIERVDLLVKLISHQLGVPNPEIDRTVETVDQKLNEKIVQGGSGSQ